MALTAITRSISACPTGAGGNRESCEPESGREGRYVASQISVAPEGWVMP